MLGKIKNIFSKARPKEEKAVEENLLATDNPNFLTEPDKIIKILSEVEANSPLCTIQIKGLDENFSSTILSVDAGKNLLLLDELVPKEGNAELQRCKSLKFSAFHKGIHLSFSISDIEIGISRGITYYKGSIPNRIYYPQRRKAPRIEIRKSNIQFYGISERTKVPVSGSLFDLSRGGAGINVPLNRARILRGDRLTNCQISFEDYLMDFDFDVRFVKSTAVGSSNLQIGGVFDKLSLKSQSKLSHFITSLERLEIRRQKS